MNWPQRRVPQALRAELPAEDRVQAIARVAGGRLLAASRFGLWVVDGEVVDRIRWELVSRALLRAGTLTVTVAAVAGAWPDGTVLLRDDLPREFPMDHASALTDAVHQRVRRSVAASARLDWPDAGCWVVLRRVPGRDGLVRQLRLDADADPDAPGLAAAVERLADGLDAESR